MAGPIRSATANHQQAPSSADSPFAAPHHSDSVTAALSSTRDLVNDLAAPSPKRVLPPTVSPSASSKSKDKDKSPLRHSFRNILSLLKEKKGKFTNPSGDLKPPSSDKKLLHKDLPAPPPPPPLVESASPSRASQSGTLIYLIPKDASTGSAASPITPIWTTSTILLKDGKITVSWFAENETSGSMIPRVHEISLASCTDIRSIPLDALDPKSIEALSAWRSDDSKGIPVDDLKPFEILFERNPRQVFAVRSVRERAKWISAFWDAVLSAGTSKVEERGRKGQGANLTRDTRWKKARFSNLPSDDEDEDGRSPSPLSMRYRGKHHSAPTTSVNAIPPVLTKRDRSLPPLPSSRLDHSTTSVEQNPEASPRLGTVSLTQEVEIKHDESPPKMSRTANSSTKSVYSVPDLPMPVTLQPQLQSRSRSGSGTRHLRVQNKSSSPQGSSMFSYQSINSSSSGATASTGTPRPTTKRFSSPSVVNLSSLSVVKQRLAALERNASQETSVSLGRPGSRSSGFSSPDAQRRSRLTDRPRSSSTTPTLMARDNATRTSRVSPLVYGLSRTRSGGTGTKRPDTTPVSGLPATFDEALPLGTTTASTAAALEAAPLALSAGTSASAPNTRDENANQVKKGKEKATYDGLDARTTTRSTAGDDPMVLNSVELEEIARGVRGIKSILGGGGAALLDGDAIQQQPTVHQIALGLDHRLSGANDLLKEVKERLERMESRIVSATGASNGSTRKASSESTRENANAAARTSTVKRAGSGGGSASRIPLKRAGGGSGTPPLMRKEDLLDAKEVRELLREIKGRLDSEIPALSAKIADMNAAKDLKGGGGARDGDDVINALKDVDLIPLREKLAELLTVVGASREEVGIAHQELREEVTAIVSILEDDVGHRERQAAQQADSVRYLNELNKWLETFVNNGTSQIQALAESIDTLCTEMGVTSPPNDSLSGDEKQPQTGGGTAAPGNSNLLSNVRQLVLGMKARDTNMASLQASVNDLVSLLSAETRIDSLTLVRMLEVQKQNQEAMLRAFSSEISGEIKGERLRFVEAMKEATAINVHQHVEQFRKELSREVHNQSRELERLQQEKQDIEHQIADLFTFYSKHKASLGRANSLDPDGLLLNPYLSRSRTEGKPSKAAKALPVSVAKASSARGHRQVYGDHNYYKFAPGGPLPYPLEPY